MTPIDWNDSEPTFPDFLPPKAPKKGRELTGLRRYVTTSAGLVLQVEYSEYNPLYSRHICYWRNANPEDVSEAVVSL